MGSRYPAVGGVNATFGHATVMAGDSVNAASLVLSASVTIPAIPVAVICCYLFPMSDKKPLSDIDVHDALIKATDELPDPERCETRHAKTALQTAKGALLALQMALLTAIDRREP